MLTRWGSIGSSLLLHAETCFSRFPLAHNQPTGASKGRELRDLLQIFSHLLWVDDGTVVWEECSLNVAMPVPQLSELPLQCSSDQWRVVGMAENRNAATNPAIKARLVAFRRPAPYFRCRRWVVLQLGDSDSLSLFPCTQLQERTLTLPSLLFFSLPLFYFNHIQQVSSISTATKLSFGPNFWQSLLVIFIRKPAEINTNNK